MGAAQSEEYQIIESAIGGDKSAFGTLFDRYFAQIFGYLRVRCASEQDAEDMAEVVFINAWENLPNFRSKNGTFHFRAWLFRIAHNQVVDHYRKVQRESPMEEAAEVRDQRKGPEEALLANDEKEKMMDALKKLDGRMQEVIIARFMQGLSHQETAVMLGISPGNVRIIQFRALKQLNELMREDGKK